MEKEMKTYQELAEGTTRAIPLDKIKKTIMKATKDIVGKQLSLEQIRKAFDKALSTEFDDVDVRTTSGTGIEQNNISVMATYAHESDDIEIIFANNPKDKEYTINKEGWVDFVHLVSTHLQHEKLHQTQAANREYKINKKLSKSSGLFNDVMKVREYLGSDDEIEAYALNIAANMMKGHGSKKEALKALRGFKKESLRDPANSLLFKYLTAFGFDTKHTVIKKLVKKVVLFISKEKFL